MPWTGIAGDRVVAVVATGGGCQRVSTGFLVAPEVVLTAGHGLVVGNPVREADSVRVVAGASGSSEVTSRAAVDGLDMGVLTLAEELATRELEPVRWGRVDRT